MDDLISRQAAIDAVCMEWCGVKHQDCKHPFDVEKDDYFWCDGCETVLRTLPDLPSAEPEQPPEIQDILNYLDTVLHPILSPERWDVYSELHDMISTLPSAEPERTCVNCGRTVNNGGWYADGRTRCPIEEHYALPKDGYCHLWEKRNVTDDDYPERRTDE